MNKKIKRYLDEIQKTEKKIADLQSYLRGIRTALKQEENNEIVKIIRGMKLGSQELIDVLSGIQDGSMTIQELKKQEPDNKSIQRDASEREEEYDESKDIK